jgi:hypothetical protein
LEVEILPGVSGIQHKLLSCRILHHLKALFSKTE